MYDNAAAIAHGQPRLLSMVCRHHLVDCDLPLPLPLRRLPVALPLPLRCRRVSGLALSMGLRRRSETSEMQSQD